jgi:hypothetical protein
MEEEEILSDLMSCYDLERDISLSNSPFTASRDEF